MSDRRYRRAWLAVAAAAAVWIFMPEIRRVVDWHFGFEPIPLSAVVPPAVLVPFWIAAARRWADVPSPMRAVAWAWIGGFAYALALAFAAGNAAAGTYTFALFVLPLGVGLWVSTLGDAGAGTPRAVAQALLFFATVSSAYGIFQYVAPPPWDVHWMNAVGPILGGYPVPFQVRVFGTLNSAGPFANVVAVVIVAALALARSRSPLFAVQIMICTVALALSSVRSAWLALALGVVVYMIVAPNKASILKTVAVVGLASVALLVVLPAAVGNAIAGESVQKRFATLSDIGKDESANNRQEQIAAATSDVSTEPLGQGLGVVGTATKLSTAAETATVLDSGYLSRLSEMGLPGFAAFALALGLALFTALRATGRGSTARRNVAAAAFAVQVMLIGQDVSGDIHLGLPALCAWTLVGIVAGGSRSSAVEPAVERRIRRVLATPVIGGAA